MLEPRERGLSLEATGPKPASAAQRGYLDERNEPTLMNGWLIKAASRGAGPDAPLIHEVFAVRHANAVDAVAAVEHKNGSYDPPPVTLRPLPVARCRSAGTWADARGARCPAAQRVLTRAHALTWSPILWLSLRPARLQPWSEASWPI